ncbi:MAG TPA: S46 family peptidase [Saprospiraceae bacterium]|nr:S46 family peptidase [Saprospiraceae bacterium]HPN68948.1 S46 family peptidase [Saprospiraceae bacterium]
MRILSTLLLLTIYLQTYAGEGMWLPHLLKAMNEKDMQAMGMKLKAEDIYSVNKGSLKDAIVHFGGFCTGEVISAQGLVLTNHHCGYDNILSHSTLEKNYMKNGFWSKSLKEELPNKGLFVKFIEKIEDVTSQIMAGISPGISLKERQILIDANIAKFKAQMKMDKFHAVDIKPFFAGNQYLAFYTVSYNDIRLVGTPPESIGKFGADTDNWVWPRHTGDFSLFRIYAGPNNEPADYAENNKPFTPSHFLPVSLDGVEEGDFTMIFGFPGRTDEYLPAIAVEQVMDVSDPAKIAVRDAALKVMDKYMRKDPVTKLKYAGKFATIANYWKKWIGEAEGLKKTNAVYKKLKFEKEFERRANLDTRYKGLLPRFNALYEDIEEVSMVRDYFSEAPNRNIELLRLMNTIRPLVSTFENNGAADYEKMKLRVLTSLEAFYKEYAAEIDHEIFERVMEICVQNIPAKYLPTSVIDKDIQQMALKIYGQSNFTDMDKAKAVLSKNPAEAVKMIQSDPAFMLANEWNDLMKIEVSPIYDITKAKIDSLQMIYMKAQMDLFPEKKFYPDANSTLRVTFGKVSGFKPKDGLIYDHTTHLDGVIEKYIPSDYEFDVDPKLLDLYNKKDYGPYADETGSVPVCFLGSNHTTGGNSGSPAIDANGNLIGLNFDRVWEGTMSDNNYDPSICRNIMVDARYILFIIDKHAGANRLIDEMKLVHPKKKKKKKKQVEAMY